MEDINFLLNFASNNTLKDTINDLKILNAEYDEFQSKLKGANGKVNGAGDSKELNAAIEQVRKLQQEYIDLKKSMEAADQQKKKSKAVTDEEILAQERKRQAMNDARKAARDLIKDEDALTLANKKQATSIKELQEQTNALVRIRAKQDLSTKEGKKRFDELTEAIRKNDKQLKDYDTSIGRSTRYVGEYQRAFKGLGQQILNFAGITGGIFFFKDAIEGIAEFEQSLADLRAILGITADSKEFKYLQEQSMALGTTTTARAVEVVEAYKLIASAKPELLENVSALNQVTKAAITLADASGLALPEAATALTDAMNQFGAAASEAQRYIDALANGAKYGSAEVPQITEALLKFGVAAKSSNVSIEESVGLIETFAEKGLKGAEAGTALRNILLKLSAAKALPKEALNQLNQAGVDINILSDNTLSLSTRLRELSKIQNNATALVKVFGVENEVAAQALLQNVDRVDKLTGQMSEYGTAAAQASERTDTIQGELKKLANAWQAAIIKFGQGGGSLKNIIKFIRENLETILEVVINVTQAFLAYKVAVASVNAVYKVQDVFKYISGLKGVKKALEGAEQAQIATNRAMKANVIGLVVAGLVTLIDQLDLFKSSAELAAESQERINGALEKGVSAISEIEDAYREQNALLEQRYELQLREARHNGASAEEIKKIEAEKADAIKNGASKAYAGLIVTYDAAQKRLQQLQEKAKMVGETLANSTNVAITGQIDTGLNGLSINEAIQAQEKFIRALEEKKKATQLEFREKELTAKEEALNQEETLTKAQIDRIKKAKEDEYQALLKQFESEKILEETAILRTTESEQEKADKKLGIEQNFLEKKLVIDKIYNKDWEKTEQELVLKKIEIEKRELERKKKLNDQILALSVEAIEDPQQQEKAKVELDFYQKMEELKTDKSKEAQELRIALYEEYKRKIAEIDKKYDDQESENEAQLYANQLYYEEQAELMKEKKRKEDKENLKKNLSELYEMSQEAFDLVSQAYSDALDQKQQRDQQALEKQNENVRLQEERAIAGLENTLAEEKAIQAERERQLLIDQKKAEKAKEIEAFFNALAEFSKDDPLTAPAKAFLQVQIGKAFVSRFEEGGIVNDVVNRNGIGGRIQNGIFKGRSHRSGGILIEAEGEEGIFSKTEMKNLGADNFYALKDRLSRPIDETIEHNDRLAAIVVPRQPFIDLGPLAKKMEEIKQAVEDKPVASLQIDHLLNAIYTVRTKGKTHHTVVKPKGFNN